MTTGKNDDRNVLRAAQTALATGQPRKALQLLNQSKSDGLAVRNARGVCLLYIGERQMAQDHYRTLVLNQSGLGLRAGTPTAVRANYALALLANGLPIGAERLLFEIADDSHPAVQRVRMMLARWRATLPWWRRALLKVGVQMQFGPITMDLRPAEIWIPEDTADAAPRADAPLGKGPASKAA